jgi:MFS transporter, PAT family, beta-lactamase induction signal transducer AmpG
VGFSVPRRARAGGVAVSAGDGGAQPGDAPPSAKVAHPLAWVPSAYLAEGIPFAMVIWVAGTMLKDLGHGDGEITLATASIGIAWSLKPLWAAFLDMFKTKKFFVLSMEYAMAVVLCLIAFAVQLPNYFHLVIAGLWVLAFASATQDICVDGVYITSLDKRRQAAWIGVQGMAWNGGRIFATAVVVWAAGSLQEDRGMDARVAWSYALGLSAAAMGLLAVYHGFALPTGSTPRRPRDAREVVTTFADTLRDFFAKKQIWGMLLFVFLYRSGEGFLLIEAPLFLQAPLEEGGVGLTLKEKGFIDGTISTAISIFGGILGGAFISKFGLKRALLFMALCMNVPHLCFVVLSQSVSADSPMSLTFVATLVTIEKFGYSFGFVANMLYMMQQISPGKYHMTHYAFCTALMNLVLIPTQMASGPLAELLGYKAFFLFVMVASIPSVIAAWLAPFPNAAADEPAGQGELASEAREPT